MTVIIGDGIWYDKPGKKSITWWIEFIGKEMYEKQIFRLQNEAGLTLREAWAILTPYQVHFSLANDLGVTVDDLRESWRSGQEKVKNITGDDWEKYEDLVPTVMRIAI